MRLSVSSRLALTIGVLVVVALMPTIAVYVCLNRVQRIVRDVGEIYEPLNSAIYRAGAAADQTSLQTLQYLDAPSPERRREVAVSLGVVERACRDYAKLAGRPGGEGAVQPLQQLFRQFKSTIDGLMRSREERENRLTTLRAELQALRGIATLQLDPSGNPTGQYGLQRQMEAKNLQQELEHLEQWTEQYLETPGAKNRQRLSAALDRMHAGIDRMRYFLVSPGERQPLERFTIRLRGAERNIRRLLAEREQVRTDLRGLKESRDALYAGLQEARLRSMGEAQGSRNGAEAAFHVVRRITGTLVPLLVVVGLAAMFLLVRSITEPIRRLAAGTAAVGGGDLGYRIPIRGSDEFAALARRFNAMVERLQATTVSRERLAASEEELRKANLALQEADRRKNQFLAVLGHELRNPLAGISNATAVLRSDRASEAAARRAWDVLQRQVRHVSRLVDDLLDVTRIVRGKIRLRVEPVELTQLARHCTQTLTPQLDAREQHLELELPEEPVYVLGDPVRLDQVLTNLLHNAVKYTEPGGQIRLRIERGGEQVAIRVQDTGAGIPAEMLPRVFELFTQVENTAEVSQGGLGLGLNLVRHLVELHNGTVSAHSDGPGHGSEFVVMLPVPKDEVGRMKDEGGRSLSSPAMLDLSPVRTHPSSFIPHPSQRVLVIDDERDAAETLLDLLEVWGHEGRAAGTGHTGIETFRAWRPDVALIDIGLPDMEGYEVARRLRGEPGSAAVLLVATTGFGRQEDRDQAWEAGFDHHLTKPLDLECLRRILDQGAGGRGASEEAEDLASRPA
jgi:signal transduction histidine kinase/CheY-like chemotaxis protein